MRSQLFKLSLLTIVFLLAGAARAEQTEISAPAASGTFGQSVAVLPNGNIVVTDPGFDQTVPSAVTSTLR